MTKEVSVTLTIPDNVDAEEVLETMVQDFYAMNQGSYTSDEMEQISIFITPNGRE